MGHVVADDDFVMILITSLPESWDNYTSSYLGASNNAPTLSSFKLVAILIEEDRRRKERGDSVGTTLQARNRKGGNTGRKSDNGKECTNCRKKGHTREDCWNKGGGKEGQGPRGRKGPNRANQATETNPSLNDVVYMARQSTTSKYDWYLDSGTTSHICPIKEAFTNYITTPGAEVGGIGPTPAKVAGRGTVILNCDVDGKLIRHQLNNVLHIPAAENCLISTPRLDAAGLWSVQGEGKCWIRKKGMDGIDLAIGDLMENPRLYKLRGRAELPGTEKANLAKNPKLSWDQWHARFGHLSISALAQLQREGLVEGLEIDESSIPSRSCESCIQAKQNHKPFPKEAAHRSKVPGERFMGDVWGPSRTSVGKFKYFVTFTDDASRFIAVLFLRDKAEAFDRIKAHVAMLRKQGRAPKYMRFDNGKELINAKLEELARQEGMIIEPTAPYSPSQNGVAERFNRTLLELARAMLIARNLPQFLWDEAVAHAAYLRNRAPTRALEGKTPYEAWYRRKPSVAHLREFGCDVWILDESKSRSKLDPKSQKMKFMGFMDGSKSIRYYDPDKRNVKVSRNFAFNENDEMKELEIVEIPAMWSEGCRERAS
jgi:transposase InsO family protein